METLLCRPRASAAASAPSGAVLVLTDVYGVRDAKNQRWVAAFSEATGLPVIAPDLFRGVPWSDSKFGGDTKSQAYEKWRNDHFVPERVVSDIASAAVFARETAGQKDSPTQVPLAAVGFCFGGGRLLEAIADADLRGKLTSAVAFYPTRVKDTANRSKLSETPLLIIQVRWFLANTLHIFACPHALESRL